MEIHSKKTVRERWEAVVKEYKVKGAYTQTEMRAKFLTSRCPEKGNAKDFLRSLRLKKEELAQVGVKISDEDYMSTIISSLPDTLSNFASMQMSWTMQQTSQAMDANTLMTMLLQEAERQNLRMQRRKPGTGKSKEEDKDEALSVSKDKPRGRKDAEGKVLCWNCDEEGHLKSKCPHPKKTKADPKKAAESSDTKKAGTSGTASVVEEASDEDGAWMAVAVEEEPDWFQEAVEAEKVSVVDVRGSVCAVEDVEELGDVSGEACVVAEGRQTGGVAELYDSGCTNHISPYRSRFENFEATVPRHFRAANKQTFSTSGKGELVVDVPSDEGMTQLRLLDVLYSSEVSYTLVSVGKLDEAGFSVMFGGGKCIIRTLATVRFGSGSALLAPNLNLNIMFGSAKG